MASVSDIVKELSHLLFQDNQLLLLLRMLSLSLVLNLCYKYTVAEYAMYIWHSPAVHLPTICPTLPVYGGHQEFCVTDVTRKRTQRLLERLVSYYIFPSYAQLEFFRLVPLVFNSLSSQFPMLSGNVCDPKVEKGLSL